MDGDSAPGDEPRAEEALRQDGGSARPEPHGISEQQAVQLRRSCDSADGDKTAECDLSDMPTAADGVQRLKAYVLGHQRRRLARIRDRCELLFAELEFLRGGGQMVDLSRWLSKRESVVEYMRLRQQLFRALDANEDPVALLMTAAAAEPTAPPGVNIAASAAVPAAANGRADGEAGDAPELSSELPGSTNAQEAAVAARDFSEAVADIHADEFPRGELERRAQHDAYVLYRVAEFRRKGLWSARRLPRVHEPFRAKTHWDYVLGEMAWLASDFVGERRFKVALARKVARAVVRYHEDARMAEERAARQERERLRRIASTMAREMRKFWAKVERVVQYKYSIMAEASRRRQMDRQLDQLVGKSEELSATIAEHLRQHSGDNTGSVPMGPTTEDTMPPARGLPARVSDAHEEPSIQRTGQLAGAAHRAAADGTRGSDEPVAVDDDGNDEEFQPSSHSDVPDDEDTIAMEEATTTRERHAQRQQGTSDGGVGGAAASGGDEENEDELSMLRRESERPLADVIRSLPPAMLREISEAEPPSDRSIDRPGADAGQRRVDRVADPVPLAALDTGDASRKRKRTPVPYADDAPEKRPHVSAAESTSDLTMETSPAAEDSGSDQMYVPDAADTEQDADVEATIAEEELLAGRGDGAKEVAVLEAEREMPLAELMATYGYVSVHGASEKTLGTVGVDGDSERVAPVRAPGRGHRTGSAAPAAAVDIESDAPPIDARSESATEPDGPASRPVTDVVSSAVDGSEDDDDVDPADSRKSASDSDDEEVWGIGRLLDDMGNAQRDAAPSADGAVATCSGPTDAGSASNAVVVSAAADVGADSGRKAVPTRQLDDVAAAAAKLQPTGNTLSTTQVTVKVPFLLRGTLREYQHVGLEWLVTMHDKRLNGILADEMVCAGPAAGAGVCVGLSQVPLRLGAGLRGRVWARPFRRLPCSRILPASVASGGRTWWWCQHRYC